MVISTAYDSPPPPVSFRNGPRAHRDLDTEAKGYIAHSLGWQGPQIQVITAVDAPDVLRLTYAPAISRFGAWVDLSLANSPRARLFHWEDDVPEEALFQLLSGHPTPLEKLHEVRAVNKGLQRGPVLL